MEIIKVETVERVVTVTTSTEPREAIITVQPFQPREINVEGSHVVVGIPGKDFKYEDFTPEQLALLQGKDGKDFQYSDFTPEQLALLKGEKGEPFTFEDFTDAQLLLLKGDKGKAFEYSDFTAEQLALLKGTDGKSTYQIWLDAGNVGSANDFLNSLKGNEGTYGWSPLLVMDSTTIDGKSLLKLTDWTGGTGTKPTTNVGKWLKGDGTYTSVPSEANDLKGASGDNLILEYVHSGNKEALIRSIDYTTNTFTSIGHGFLNNQRVCFSVDLDVAFPSLVLPISNGLPNNGFNWYYIINVTQDTFQLSTSSGGSPFVLNNKPTVDFSKFKIEQTLPSLSITNLPSNLTDVKVEIFGKSNRANNNIYINPNGISVSNWISGSNITSMNANGGTVFINGIYEFSIKNNICQAKQDIYVVTSTNDTTNSAVLKQQSFVKNAGVIQFITGIGLETSAIPNGFIVRIYKK